MGRQGLPRCLSIHRIADKACSRKLLFHPLGRLGVRTGAMRPLLLCHHRACAHLIGLGEWGM